MSIDWYPNDEEHFVTSSFSTEDDSGIKFWQFRKSNTGFKVEPQYLYDLQGGH